MKIVFASYVYVPEFNRPQDWITRIQSYGGILEALALKHTVITIEHIDYEGEYKHNGVQFYFKRFSKTGRRFPLQLHQFIKSLEPDIVFIQGLHFSLQIIQLRLYLGSKIRIMAQHHAEKPFAGRIKKRIQQLADRCIDAYLFVSHDMGMEWVNKGNLASGKKIHGVMEISSIFYPVDKTLALAKTGVAGSLAFLWVGRLNQNKDPLNVVSAFLRFAKVNPSARLYMIYQTEDLLPQIIELLNNDPEHKEAIILVGSVPHHDLLYWFNSADVVISGSHYESAGTAICEAMSCGCVPIVTDIVSFRMMTDNGRCGLLYPPGNETMLLSRLIQTMEINMGQKRELAMAYYKAKLSFAAIAGSIEQVAAAL